MRAAEGCQGRQGHASGPSGEATVSGEDFRRGSTIYLMPLAPLLALALLAGEGSSFSAQPRFASLHGGETLGVGGSEVVFGAGFSTLSAAYAQGLSNLTDYGAQLELDWLTTELFAGGLLRQLTWRSGEVFVSWRGRAGLYADLGSTWAVDSNDADVGVQLAPGLALSRRFSRSTLSLAGDVPLNLTFSRGGGFAIGLKGSLAFETPLRDDLLVG